MAKRQRRRAGEDESDDNSGSYVPKPSSSKSNKVRSTRRASAKKQRCDSMEGVETAADTCASQHAASLHVISSPLPLRAALLSWYAKVHETRGMPWRKPYDPTLSSAARAQRAYEVWISEIMLQQGGSTKPPELTASAKKLQTGISGHTIQKRRTAKKLAAGAKESERNEDDVVSAPLTSRWILLDDVENANIGTGVLKIWNQVKTIW